MRSPLLIAFAATLVASFLLSASTYAQPSAAPAKDDSVVYRVSFSETPLSVSGVGGRTLGQAQTYTFGGTLASVGLGLGLMIANSSDGAVLTGGLLVLGGGLVGPSLGHFYLGDSRRAWIGIGLRTAGVGAGALVGNMVAQNSDEWFAGLGEFMLIGAVGLVAGSFYSFATLDDAARERGIAIVPTVQPDGTPALALTARF